MQKLILFIDNLGAGGAQRQLVGLAVLLKERGYDVQVAVYQDYSFYQNYLEENGVPFVIIPNAANSIMRIPAVTKYLRQQKPDWVIAYQESPSTFACLAQLLGARFKLIVSERNTTQRVTWREKLRFFLYRKAEWIVPNSYAQEEFLKACKPKLAPKISTITNFVDLDRFKPVNHELHDKTVFINASSVSPSKNTLRFIEAMHKVVEQNPESKFEVRWFGLIGDMTEYKHQCIDKIKEYHLEEVVRLLPKTQDIVAEFAKADAFVFPSIYEGTPNALCETVSCGLPAVCSAVCDNGRFVKEVENGFLCDPTSVDSIAEAFCKMLRLSVEERCHFGKSSRQIAESLLDKDVFVEKYIKLVEG